MKRTDFVDAITRVSQAKDEAAQIAALRDAMTSLGADVPNWAPEDIAPDLVGTVSEAMLGVDVSAKSVAWGEARTFLPSGIAFEPLSGSSWEDLEKYAQMWVFAQWDYAAAPVRSPQ